MSSLTPIQKLARLCRILLLVVILQSALSYGGLLRVGSSVDDSAMLRKSEQLLGSIEPSVLKLRLDIREYLMVHDEKYLSDFQKEIRRLLSALDAISKEALFRDDAQMIQAISTLGDDLQSYENAFLKIVAYERENASIEGGVFAKYNLMLEEHPNRILFQAFGDNDPMSGNSAAYLLDTLLKYKIAVSSYIVNNNAFFLIRIKELNDDIIKHADKIELMVDNKDSMRRIKQFKEAFTVYAKGFETLATNTQARQELVKNTSETLAPRISENALSVLSRLEKLRSSVDSKETDTILFVKLVILILAGLSLLVSFIFTSTLGRAILPFGEKEHQHHPSFEGTSLKKAA